MSARSLPILIAVLLVAACENGTDRPAIPDTTPSLPADVSDTFRIETEPSQVTLTATGLTETLTAQVFDANDEVVSRPITWFIANPHVATIADDGTLTALAQGSTVAVADSGGWSHGVPVTVVDVLPDRAGARFDKIAAGFFHTCALDTAGAAWCWGWNSDGQVGVARDQHPEVIEAPLSVSDRQTFTTISVGAFHSCALTAVGEAWCWGSNTFGEIGRADIGTAGSHVSVRVDADLLFAQIAPGGSHTCALDVAGAAWCWGRGSVGELGNGSTVHQHAPVAVAGGHTFVQVTSGSAHTCALDDTGSTWCWGEVSALASGTMASEFAFTPVPVATGHTFNVVHARSSHACGVTDDGEVWCWGRNDAGQLGVAAGAARREPVHVPADTTFTTVVTGFSYSCALAMDGAVWCWGTSEWGVLGNGNVELRGLRDGMAAAPVLGDLRFTNIDGGGPHVCATTSAGESWCWGAALNAEIGAGFSGHFRFSVAPWPVEMPP